MITDGTYEPKHPDGKPLTLGGKRIIVKVWSLFEDRYLDVFAGKWDAVYADVLPAGITSRTELTAWVAAHVKTVAHDRAVRAEWDAISDSCTFGSQRWHAMMGASENADLTMQDEGGIYGDQTSTRWFEVAVMGFESNMATGEYEEPEDPNATYAVRVPNVILDYAKKSETTQVDLSALEIRTRTYSSLTIGTRKEMTALADYIEHLVWLRESRALGRDELDFPPSKLRVVSERIYKACEHIFRLPS